ncbi:MAG: DUF2339 domain-containing protein [Gemmatimonadaceae bacterium]
MDDHIAPPDPKLAERVAALEWSVRALTQDLAALRTELRDRAAAPGTAGTARPYTGPTPTPPPPPRVGSYAPPTTGAPFSPRPADPGPREVPPRRPAATWSGADLESLLGRYGMLALGGLTALSAVGIFIRWAVAHVVIGPELRVALGLIAALALGIAGWRLRPRERTYGNALLGIALAIVHLCAWGAGPTLGIVPAPVALALATLASAALAVYAHREDDETLWCLGFGGAAVAPFVTSRGEGQAIVLAAYGALVMIAGAYSLGERQWRAAHRVTLLSAAWYTLVLAAMPRAQGAPAIALAFPFAIAWGGIIPCAGDGMRRARLRGLGVMAALAAITAAARGTGLDWMPALALAGIGFALWLILVEQVAHEPAGALVEGFGPDAARTADYVDAGLVPVLFVIAALVASPWGAATNEQVTRVAVATVGAAAMLGFALRREEGTSLRDAAVVATCATAVAGALFIGDITGDAWGATLIAALAVAFATMDGRAPSGAWQAMATLAMLFAGLFAWSLLGLRPAYRYAPFIEPAALAALAVSIGWVVLARLAPDGGAVESRAAGASGGRLPARSLRLIAAAAWTFIWVFAELDHAVSPRVSNVLVVTWTAAVSVWAVWMGRRERLAALRITGLLLAVAAAIRAALGAAMLDETWAQVAGYLVASGFLMGIAWWYRRGAAAD